MGARQLVDPQNLINRLDELPTLPNIVYELSRVINDPMSSTSDVEKLMSNDQSMTSKVLRLVNSSYYAIPGGVSSLARAIAFIGFDTVNQLVLSASIIKALETKGEPLFDMSEFWKHSIGVAIAAETIAKFVSHPLPADLFTCGLVHDMGKVATYTLEPELMLSTVSFAANDNATYYETEKKMGLPPHTLIGQALAQKWALPSTIQATIAYHHEKDPAQRNGLTADLHRNVDIVILANLFTHGMKFGKSGHAKILGAPKDVMIRLTIDPDRHLKHLLMEIRTNFDKAHDFLRVLGGST